MAGEAELIRLGEEEDRALDCAIRSTLFALVCSASAPVAEHYAGTPADLLVYLLWAAWLITLSNWVAVRRIQKKIARAAAAAARGGGEVLADVESAAIN